MKLSHMVAQPRRVEVPIFSAEAVKATDLKASYVLSQWVVNFSNRCEASSVSLDRVEIGCMLADLLHIQEWLVAVLIVRQQSLDTYTKGLCSKLWGCYFLAYDTDVARRVPRRNVMDCARHSLVSILIRWRRHVMSLEVVVHHNIDDHNTSEAAIARGIAVKSAAL